MNPVRTASPILKIIWVVKIHTYENIYFHSPLTAFFPNFAFLKDKGRAKSPKGQWLKVEGKAPWYQ